MDKAITDIGFLSNLFNGQRVKGFILQTTTGGLENLLTALNADFILFQMNTPIVI